MVTNQTLWDHFPLKHQVLATSHYKAIAYEGGGE